MCECVSVATLHVVVSSARLLFFFFKPTSLLLPVHKACGMELRPARGRAQVILGRERFRCSRCGAKASAYFNIDDMNDPRAVARLERLKEQENLEEADIDDDDDGGDVN